MIDIANTFTLWIGVQHVGPECMSNRKVADSGLTNILRCCRSPRFSNPWRPDPCSRISAAPASLPRRHCPHRRPRMEARIGHHRSWDVPARPVPNGRLAVWPLCSNGHGLDASIGIGRQVYVASHRCPRRGRRETRKARALILVCGLTIIAVGVSLSPRNHRRIFPGGWPESCLEVNDMVEGSPRVRGHRHLSTRLWRGGRASVSQRSHGGCTPCVRVGFPRSYPNISGAWASTHDS